MASFGCGGPLLANRVRATAGPNLMRTAAFVAVLSCHSTVTSDRSTMLPRGTLLPGWEFVTYRAERGGPERALARTRTRVGRC